MVALQMRGMLHEYDGAQGRHRDLHLQANKDVEHVGDLRFVADLGDRVRVFFAGYEQCQVIAAPRIVAAIA